MSAHSVLLNLLNELRETDKGLCRVSYRSFFRNKCNKFI